jgi:hypothetical protein
MGEPLRIVDVQEKILTVMLLKEYSSIHDNPSNSYLFDPMVTDDTLRV